MATQAFHHRDMADTKPKRKAPFMQRIQRGEASARGKRITRINIGN